MTTTAKVTLLLLSRDRSTLLTCGHLHLSASRTDSSLCGSEEWLSFAVFQRKVMNTASLKALIPAGMLFSGSVVLFLRGKTVWSFLQLLGAWCLVVVVLTHVSEALHTSPLDVAV